MVVQMDSIVVTYRAAVIAEGGAGAALGGHGAGGACEVGAGGGDAQGRRIWALLVDLGWVLVEDLGAMGTSYWL